jgi:ATP/ADP translocase
MKPVLYLMVFSFFVGLSMSFYFAASNAIFLKHFQRGMISLSYMASGVVVWAAWWILSRIDRKLNLEWQLIVKFLFVFSTVSAISAGVWFYDTPWIVFTMFTWIRILVYVTLVTFWGLAGKLFNIRQGKRIFGLLGVGEVISIIIGYFSIPLLLRFLKAPDLLFLSSGALFCCLILVVLILRKFREQLCVAGSKPEKAKKESASGLNYLKLIRKPYFLLVSLMALLPIFGYLFVDFLFLAQTKVEFSNKPETIASFMGIFLGFVALVELGFKLVSGRFMNKFGLKPSLVSLPVMLLVGIILAATSGTIYGTIGLFFVFISLARLFERSVRASLYEPAFQLLYQPIPSDQRLIFQNQIEGIPKALGTVVTGLILFAFSAIHALNLVFYTWFFIAVLCLWTWISLRMYKSYRFMLKLKLSSLRAPELSPDAHMAKIIRETLTSESVGLFDKVYDILEMTEPITTEKSLLSIYPESDERLKLKILNKVDEKQMVQSVSFLRIDDTTSESGELENRRQQAIRNLEQAAEYSFGFLSELSTSNDRTDRYQAARLLGSSARYNSYKLLLALMKDPDQEIKRIALISSGKVKRHELWPYIIENLSQTEYAWPAMVALRQIGESILPELDNFFVKMNQDRNTQLRIITVIEELRGSASVRFLRKYMNHPDKDIRRQVLTSLSNRRYHAASSESAQIKNNIEETTDYIAWLLATLQDISHVSGITELQLALLTEIEEKKEYIFKLLALLYESKTIGYIRENIESKEPNAKLYALEIGDMIIEDDVKDLFFPLFEDITVQERLQRLSGRFPQEKMQFVDRLHDVLNQEFTLTNQWTKACAILQLKNLNLDNWHPTYRILAANLVNPNPLLNELAASVLHHLDYDFYTETISRFNPGNYPMISALDKKIRDPELNSGLLLVDKVMILRNTEFFKLIPETRIIDFLLKNKEICFVKGWLQPDITMKQGLIMTSGSGYTIFLPEYSLYELLYNSPENIRRLLRSIQIHPNS